jgi:hypothetical protein
MGVGREKRELIKKLCQYILEDLKRKTKKDILIVPKD